MRLATITLLSAFALGAAGPLAAQERRVPSSPAEMRLSFAPVVQRVAPAVVNVYAAKTVQARNPLFEDPLFRRFFGVPGERPRTQSSLLSRRSGTPCRALPQLFFCLLPR